MNQTGVGAVSFLCGATGRIDTDMDLNPPCRGRCPALAVVKNGSSGAGGRQSGHYNNQEYRGRGKPPLAEELKCCHGILFSRSQRTGSLASKLHCRRRLSE